MTMLLGDLKNLLALVWTNGMNRLTNMLGINYILILVEG